MNKYYCLIRKVNGKRRVQLASKNVEPTSGYFVIFIAHLLRVQEPAHFARTLL